ncbi:MAG: hypothetical protein HY773_00870 [Candidatus Terrybacteria bacterium]|nr:hypothetical protein [Candidatus Terrybacteria bacterium]
MQAFEKISKILRTDKDVIRIIEEKMSEIVGHNNVLNRIIEENEARMESSLKNLKIYSRGARDIYSALIERIREDDIRIAKLIRKEAGDGSSDFQNMIDVAKKASGVGKGRFLKIEKAQELLVKNPPQKILQFLGYKNVQELLKSEDIFEIFAGLRFMESGEWLNNVFFRPYENLIPDDFEEREITVKVLSERWVSAAEKFLRKKYHNLSHLKELGFVFVIPVDIGIPGSNLRNFSLALHYLHEVKFYSDLFRRYSVTPNFAANFVSALRGDAIDIRPEEKEIGRKWLIIQRYLAKDDEYDWRLFYPHVNPEAIHWQRAENDIARLSQDFDLDFEFWKGLGPVGDFFKDEAGVGVLVSFNFLDTVMSLFQEKEMVKYLYHHQEALWNKIFTAFFGEKKMEELIIENFDKGFIFLKRD